ncbi:hypothetical protein [Mucilaginibacter segetis]|uniref:Uncharacterized protein n=1 Tax=Mucilaginibacter segetis TaxID=2793071 RepID=A0A934PV54_9SPHI|nr:hypothetical protein [Mucilaginibacter segetis]MBK0379655.1 hypothetical protein [Mucilaginibacter segetis]
MKNLDAKKLTMMLIVGLLVVSTVPAIHKVFHLTDLLAGLLTGFGLGVEIMAAILLVKLKKDRRHQNIIQKDPQ